MTALVAPGIAPNRMEPDARPSPLHGTDPLIVGVVLHRDQDAYLEHCLVSLSAQTRPLATIVVAHLGCGDPPAWVWRRLPDVRVLAASGPAPTAAVVEEIVASYPADGYLFQEATDWSAPDRLERLLRKARSTGADLVGSDFVVVEPRVPDAHTRVMPPDGNLAFQRGTGGTVVEPSTMLVSRNVIERLGGFNTHLTVAAANEFVARAAAAARVVNVSRPLCFTRAHDAADWSSSSAGETIVGRVVFAALSERSRHHAVSLARRQRPDVSVREHRRRVELIHVGGPTTPLALPSPDSSPQSMTPAPGAMAHSDEIAVALNHPAPPVFVVSAFESLSRFVTCCLGQHPALQTVEVTPWMTEVAQLSARFLESERRGELGGRMSTAVTAEAVYRAASVAVDALFVGGPFATSSDDVSRSTHRWIGAIPADKVALTAAALLYPDAIFLHVARPVDETVQAQLEVQDDADIEELYNAWLAATHTILDVAQLLDTSRMRTLHYDRLVADPGAVLRTWLEVLGEEPEPACAGLFVRSGADAPTGRTASRMITDLAGIPAQHEARRLSLALSGLSGATHDGEPSQRMARILTEQRIDAGRRRRSTDLVDDDRNPYAPSHDLIRRHAPKETIVCVVSKGDEMAVRIRGHSVGWHFPQTEDGAYAGYHPTDAREAIAHLEHLRDQGAQLFLIPEVYLWWLNHYTELRLHLERTYTRVPSTEGEGALFDLRGRPRVGLTRAMDATR